MKLPRTLGQRLRAAFLKSSKAPRRRKGFSTLRALETFESRMLLSAVDLVSQGVGPNALGGGTGQEQQSVSDDGRYVVFSSGAGNMAPGQIDNAGLNDVFLFDTVTQQVRLVSHAGDGRTVGNAQSYNPVISANGKKIVYQSAASNLQAGVTDTAGSIDLFMYDIATGTNTLITHSSANLLQAVGGQSANAQISNDGLRVVYAANSTNLMAGTTGGNTFTDIYVYDATTQVNTLVTHAANNVTAEANNYSFSPQISGNGQKIIYETYATNLMADANDTNNTTDIYVYDVASGQNTLVSHFYGSTTLALYAPSVNPSISRNGLRITFETYADQVTGVGNDTNNQYDVFLYSVTTGTSKLISHAAGAGNTPANHFSTNAMISGNGQKIVFESSASNLIPGAEISGNQLYVYDIASDTTKLVTHLDGQLNVGSALPSSMARISVNGARIVYQTASTDLRNGVIDTNGYNDVYLFDTNTGVNRLLSHTAASLTATGDRSSTAPEISGNGGKVVFMSTSSDLAKGVIDGNFNPDLFINDVPTNVNTVATRSYGSRSTTADGSSHVESVSDDGRFVVFTSTATNFVLGEVHTAGGTNVYLQDNSTGVIRLVSSIGDGKTAGNGTSYNPRISGNGQKIVFESTANNLVPGQTDTNFGGDVFLYDIATQSMVLVSHTGASATTAGNKSSSLPQINDNGTLIVFQTTSTNIKSVEDDNNNASDVYVYQVSTGVNTLVSHSTAGLNVTAGGSSTAPQISGQGNKIVFLSTATNLVQGVTDTNQSADLFVYDIVTKGTTLVSRNAASSTTTGNQQSFNPSISDDGRLIAFQTVATDLVANDVNGSHDVFLFDLQTGQNRLVTSAAGNPSTTADGHSTMPMISGNGAKIAYTSFAGDLISGMTGNNNYNVFLYDIANRSTELVSHVSGNTLQRIQGTSYEFHMNNTGTRVVFATNGTNVVSGITDLNGADDVFLYDTATKANTLISRTLGSSTTTGNLASSEVLISGDGRRVLFDSRSSDLVAADLNFNKDIFSVRVGVPASSAAPVIGNVGGTVQYHPGDAGVLLDTDATVTDGDSLNFNQGKLTVRLTGNATSSDLLSVKAQGDLLNQIGLIGKQVTFSGKVIATMQGGTGTSPLIFIFNAAASKAAVQALLRRLQFSAPANTSSTVPRTVQFTLTDGDGGTSVNSLKTVEFV